MKQQNFIAISNNVFANNITMDEIGNTVVQLRETVQITHNYKKKDRMELIFTEDKATFLIPDREALEEVYRLHLGNENLLEILRKYCEDNLKRV